MPIFLGGLTCCCISNIVLCCSCFSACALSPCLLFPPVGFFVECCNFSLAACFITILASSYFIVSACTLTCCYCPAVFCSFGTLTCCCCCPAVFCSVGTLTCCCFCPAALCIFWAAYLTTVLSCIFCIVLTPIVTISSLVCIYCITVITSPITAPLSSIFGLIALPFECIFIEIIGGLIFSVLSFFFIGIPISGIVRAVFLYLTFWSSLICVTTPFVAPICLLCDGLFISIYLSACSGFLPFICAPCSLIASLSLSVFVYLSLFVLNIISPIISILGFLTYPAYCILLTISSPCIAYCTCYELLIALRIPVYVFFGIAAIIIGIVQVLLSFIFIGAVTSWPGMVLTALGCLSYVGISIVFLPITLACLPIWFIVFDLFVLVFLVFLSGAIPFLWGAFISGIITLIIGIIYFITVIPYTIALNILGPCWSPIVAPIPTLCTCIFSQTALFCICSCIQTNICLLPCYLVLSIICGISAACCLSPFCPFIICSIISAGLLAYTGTFFLMVLFTVLLDLIFFVVMVGIDLLMVLMVPLALLIISAVAFMFFALPMFLIAYTIVPPMAVIFLMTSVTIACTYPPLTWLCIIPSTACVLPCVVLFSFQIVVFSSVVTAILIPFICATTWSMQNPVICSTFCSIFSMVGCATACPALLVILIMSPPFMCGGIALTVVSLGLIGVGSAFYIVTQSCCGSSGIVPNVGTLLTTALGDVVVKPLLDSVFGAINTVIGDIDSYITAFGQYWCGLKVITDTIGSLIKSVEAVRKMTSE